MDMDDGEFAAPDPKRQYCKRSDTVIIFDWDDTLLCSSAIHTRRWSRVDLQKLERRAKEILCTAMGLGETLIVTNGNGTWVQDSAKRFLPGLLPLLSKLTVVSARALFEESYPGDPFMWKRAAFEHLLLDEKRSPDLLGNLNLVVLGDQFPEIDAAHSVATKRSGATKVKALKFVEAPSVVELRGQLCMAEQALSSIVEDPDDRSRGVVCRRMTQNHNYSAAHACGWAFEAEGQEKCTAKLEDQIAAGFKEIWQLFL